MRAPSALPLALGGMLALVSAMGIGRFVYTPILPAMSEALSLSKAGAGLIASANFGGYLVGALLAAAPRWPGGRRAWFVGALAVGAGSLVGMGLVTAMPAFLALRFIGGVCSAFVLVLGSALVLQRLAVAGQAGLASVHFAGIGTGIAGSALLIEAMGAGGADWRGLWLAAGLVAAALVPVIARLVPGDAGGGAPAPDGALPRGFWVLILSYGLFSLGYVVTATFLVAAVRAGPDARTMEPLVWLVVGLAAIPSSLAWDRVGRRIGTRRAYVAAFLVQAAGVAAGGWAAIPGFALVAAALLGGTIVGLTALGFAVARAWAPAAQRRAFATMTAGFGLGQIAGPLIAGWLLDRTGSFAFPSLLAAAALLAGAAVAACVTDPPA